jgi:hypothetical protein
MLLYMYPITFVQVFRPVNEALHVLEKIPQIVQSIFVEELIVCNIVYQVENDKVLSYFFLRT